MAYRRCTRMCRFICAFLSTFSLSSLIRQYTIEPDGSDGCRTLKPFFRYKNLSEETNAKELVLVAVMTHYGTIKTRAVGIKETWGREIPGKLLFFVGQSTNESQVDLPLITLQVPDDVYPPQRKSMFMLKYIHENYAGHFQWFIRADDDVYIRGDKLTRLLESVNSSDDVLLGHPGTGKKREEGKLGLDKNSNFCIGGTGIIMSQSVLMKVYPHLDHCIHETVTDHEDTEIGRCLRRFAGVQCPWGFEVSELFHQEYGDASNAYRGELDYIILERAVSLHPVKDVHYLYRLHVYYLSLKVRQQQNRARRLREELGHTKELLTITEKSLLHVARTPHCHRNNCDKFHDKDGTHHQDALPVIWTLMSDSKSFSARASTIPVDAIQGSTKGSLRRVTEKAKLAIKVELKTELYRSLYFGKNAVSYSRLRPIYGNSYEVHYFVNARLYGDGKTKMVRLAKGAKINAPFGTILSRMDRRKASDLVNIVLPLSGSLDSFRKFLKSVEEILANFKEDLRVLIIFYRDVASPKPYKSLFDSYAKKFLKAKFVWLEIDGSFNLNFALQASLKYFSNENNLMFFTQVEILFDSSFLRRCQQNTAAGKAYFPELFRTYRNTNDEIKFVYGKESGQWHQEDYSAFCAYSNDVLSASRGYAENVNLGGGLFIELFLKHKGHEVEIFRAPDPGLLQTFSQELGCLENHDKSCVNGFTSTEALVDYMIKKNYLKDYL